MKRMRTESLSAQARHTGLPSQTKVGISFALAANLWWGLVVFYFKAVSHVPVSEVLAHRVLWTATLLGGVLVVRGRIGSSLRPLHDRRTMLTLVVTAGLIGMSWYGFVWAIFHDRIIEISLGYYICPLVIVLLGYVFLRERLRSPQVVSVLLATVGVIVLGLSYGRIPTISLLLAFVFGFYGLLRKRVPVDPSVGLAIEMAILSPLAVLYLLHLGHTNQLVFMRGPRSTDLLLMAAGIVSATPLICYINAAKRLRYASLGLTGYVMPSMSFVIAIAVFQEPFALPQLISFCFIWLALLIYSLDSVLHSRRARGTNTTVPAPVVPSPVGVNRFPACK